MVGRESCTQESEGLWWKISILDGSVVDKGFEMEERFLSPTSETLLAIARGSCVRLHAADLVHELQKERARLMSVSRLIRKHLNYTMQTRRSYQCMHSDNANNCTDKEGEDFNKNSSHNPSDAYINNSQQQQQQSHMHRQEAINLQACPHRHLYKQHESKGKFVTSVT